MCATSKTQHCMSGTKLTSALSHRCQPLPWLPCLLMTYTFLDCPRLNVESIWSDLFPTCLDLVLGSSKLPAYRSSLLQLSYPFPTLCSSSGSPLHLFCHPAYQLIPKQSRATSNLLVDVPFLWHQVPIPGRKSSALLAVPLPNFQLMLGAVPTASLSLASRSKMIFNYIFASNCPMRNVLPSQMPGWILTIF